HGGTIPAVVALVERAYLAVRRREYSHPGQREDLLPRRGQAAGGAGVRRRRPALSPDRHRPRRRPHGSGCQEQYPREAAGAGRQGPGVQRRLSPDRLGKRRGSRAEARWRRHREGVVLLRPTPEEEEVARPDEAQTAPQEIHLAEYWAVVLKRRILIGIAAGLAVVTALAVSLVTKPLYQATTLLDVERDKGSPLDIGVGQAAEIYSPEFV